MKESLSSALLDLFGAKEVQEIETIQTLWSGYGKLSRFGLVDSDVSTVIVKNISLPSQSNHPRGWDTDRSHLRKLRSYQVEVEWYKTWAQRCNNDCRVPRCYRSISHGDEHMIILEDLDGVGFPMRQSSLNEHGVRIGLKWLANFHALFLNESPGNLWEEGTYWHLSTRPDELAAMENSLLKDMAFKLDKTLAECQYQTIVHGDAKVANFCFSEDMKQVAALDFQYVGAGCGMKDVVYFLGSCLNENECEQLETTLLSHYFKELKTALNKINPAIPFDALEKEWRFMYSIAWTDFTRFLMGWMPTHQKINGYSLNMMERAMRLLK